MSIQILEDNEPNVFSSELSTEALQSVTLASDIARGIEQGVDQAMIKIAEASEKAFRYADDRATNSIKNAEMLAQNILEKFKTEFSNITRPKVLSVSVQGEKRKLTKQASPYLGKCLVLASLGKNILLVGPAGCGKTTLAEQIGESLGREFSHISFTQGASESWLLGRHTPTGFVHADFARLYETGGVFLADEFGAADPNTIMILQSALANGYMVNPMTGLKVKRHPDFVFIAADNTFCTGPNATYTARNRLDAATLDRFCASTIVMDYDPELEQALCADKNIYQKLLTAREKLRSMGAEQIISTRTMNDCYELSLNGISFEESIKSVTASWPKNLASQVGLS